MEENTRRWADVQFDTDISLGAVVQLLNVFNQRLATLENVVAVKLEDGREMSVTEYYDLINTPAPVEEPVETANE